jgi:hypothetical protein
VREVERVGACATGYVKKSRGLGPACPGLGEDSADQPVESRAVSGDRLDPFRLLTRQGSRDLGETTLYPLVDGNRPADERAHARVDFRVESSRIAAGDLNASKLARTTCGQMLTPNTGKLHTV